ncbi:hypothetical protein F2Q68_00033867 [Brassica cretica]|uniref:Uncharacterized protein n=1 Tax=Brassica cretica TaxID=69181 RepID=A0A8S9H2X7_BRACR|nr:hypothetical protein F2Q68_00033867 [Brassica cretica]
MAIGMKDPPKERPRTPGTETWADHLKGKDQGLIAITEETSCPANPGTRGQEVWRMAIGSEEADPESREGPPKDQYRPLRMVSLKVFQSGTCSEDRDLARSSSSTPHGSRQLPTDGLATKAAGHKQREETSYEIISDGSGAEGNTDRESPIARESTEAGARDKSRSRSPYPREKQYPDYWSRPRSTARDRSKKEESSSRGTHPNSKTEPTGYIRKVKHGLTTGVPRKLMSCMVSGP